MQTTIPIQQERKPTFIEKSREHIPAFIIVCNAEGIIEEE